MDAMMQRSEKCSKTRLYILLCSILAGCQTYPAVRGYGEQAIVQAKQVNDDYRDVASNAICATSLGAHYRDTNPKAQAARACLCGGPCDVQVKLTND